MIVSGKQGGGGTSMFLLFTTLLDNYIKNLQLVWSDLMVHTTTCMYMEFILWQGQAVLVLFCPSNEFSCRNASGTVSLYYTMCFAHWWLSCNYSSFEVSSVWHRVDVQSWRFFAAFWITNSFFLKYKMYIFRFKRIFFFSNGLNSEEKVNRTVARKTCLDFAAVWTVNRNTPTYVHSGLVINRSWQCT